MKVKDFKHFFFKIKLSLSKNHVKIFELEVEEEDEDEMEDNANGGDSAEDSLTNNDSNKSDDQMCVSELKSEPSIGKSEKIIKQQFSTSSNCSQAASISSSNAATYASSAVIETTARGKRKKNFEEDDEEDYNSNMEQLETEGINDQKCSNERKDSQE